MTRARDVANIDTILTTTGDIYYASAAATPTRLGIGSSGQYLTVSGGVPAWGSVSAIPANDNASVATNESTSSTSYTDLTTTLSVTVTTGTKALVIVTSEQYCDTGNGASSYSSFAVSGATTIAAADSRALRFRNVPDPNIQSGAQVFRGSMASVVTLTAGSNTFTAKYRTSSGSSYFSNRQIIVINLA